MIENFILKVGMFPVSWVWWYSPETVIFYIER